MKPFARIVVATDFGPSSDRAVDAAIDLAKRYDATLRLVHSVEMFVPPYPIPLMPDPGTLEGAAAELLDQALTTVRHALPSAEAKLLHGEPSAAVLAYAAEHGADLLVLGTHGRRTITRLVLGSVASRILRGAKLPVLVVPAEETQNAR